MNRDKAQIAADRDNIVKHVSKHAAKDGFTATEKWMNLDDLKALTKSGALLRDVRTEDGKRRSYLSIAKKAAPAKSTQQATSRGRTQTVYAVIDGQPKTGTYQVTIRNANALDAKSEAFVSGLKTRAEARDVIESNGFVYVTNFRKAKDLENAKADKRDTRRTA